MAHPAILRPHELKTDDRGGGARTTPLVTRHCGSTGMINGITTFGPGAAIGLHKHNCEESVMVIEGEAIAEIDGVRHPTTPPGFPRTCRTASSTPWTGRCGSFWTYATVDATRTTIATGETRSIDAEHGQAAT